MELHGIGVGRGIAVGPVLRMPEPLAEPVDARRDGDAGPEFKAVTAALAAVAFDLGQRGELAGGEAKKLLAAEATMAGDSKLAGDVKSRIESGKTGERAVFEAFDELRKAFGKPGSKKAERIADLNDLSQRTIARLRGVPIPGVPTSDRPFILVASDLAPAETALLDPAMVFGLITRDGGPTSHTAILARSKSIPAIVAVDGALSLADGTFVVADAASGLITVAPEAETVASARQKIADREAISTGPTGGGVLADGTRIPLLANVASMDDIAPAIQLGAEGVGLFRTEFMFFGAAKAPTIAEQQAKYVELLSQFPEQIVVVRVLDAGADTPLSFLNQSNEPNPALGLRGLRALRASEDVLRDQLTALVNAQNETKAELWVMAPMVTDAADTDYFVTVAKELGLKTVGVMTEIPSMAVLADQVAELCDFVSIGTNDLTQYTLAADRQLSSLATYQDPWHPAVLRLIKLIGDAGRAAGRHVGICGEAAADPMLAVVLIGLGVTTLSMVPSALSDVRAELATVTLEQARARARTAISATSAAEARAVGTH
jgi:phosphoenolpyruvate-protein phosphotransferase (PTS system enzyme I)